MQVTTNHLLLLKPDQKIWNILSFAYILLKLGIVMFWLTLSKMSLDTRYPKNTKWDILKKTPTYMQWALFSFEFLSLATMFKGDL